MNRIPYLTKRQLIEENRKSIKAGRNATLIPKKLKALPDEKFPVLLVLDHNEIEARLVILIRDTEGEFHHVLLDVSYKTAKRLPTHLIDERLLAA